MKPLGQFIILLPWKHRNKRVWRDSEANAHGPPYKPYKFLTNKVINIRSTVLTAFICVRSVLLWGLKEKASSEEEEDMEKWDKNKYERSKKRLEQKKKADTVPPSTETLVGRHYPVWCRKPLYIKVHHHTHRGKERERESHTNTMPPTPVDIHGYCSSAGHDRHLPPPWSHLSDCCLIL